MVSRIISNKNKKECSLCDTIETGTQGTPDTPECPYNNKVINGTSPMDNSWIDELIKWENAHPEYEPFKEDKDSQRQENLKENY